MTKFTNVIVRRPPKSIVNAYSGTPELGRPDYDLAIEQHDAYIAALRQCGVDVTVLPAIEYLTNSVFVEQGRHHLQSGNVHPQSRTRRNRTGRPEVLHERPDRLYRTSGDA